MATKTRHVKVNDELLQNALSIAPLSTYARITNDALKLWIAVRGPRKSLRDEVTDAAEAAAKLEAAYETMTSSNTDTWVPTRVR